METTRLDPSQLQAYTCRKLRIIDYTLDDAHLETRCPLDNGRHSVQAQFSMGQLGVLRVLPLEIVNEILLTLDLPTLTLFRRVNRCAMSVVDALHQYRMVLKHCPNVLRAIISIDATFFDCWTLYKKLSTSKCESCGRFGGYLYLITCKRVCYACFTLNDDYFPVLLAHANKHTGLKRRELRRYVPNVFSLPGRYTARGTLEKRSITLLDRHVLRDMAWNMLLNGGNWRSVDAFEGNIRQHRDPAREPRRYMSIVSAPYLGSSGQSADWGFYCTVCRDNGEPETHCRNKYTKDDILRHLRRRHRIMLSLCKD